MTPQFGQFDWKCRYCNKSGCVETRISILPNGMMDLNAIWEEMEHDHRERSDSCDLMHGTKGIE